MSRILRIGLVLLFATMILVANLPVAAANPDVAAPMEPVIVFNRIVDSQDLAIYQASLSGGCVPDYVVHLGMRPCADCNHINNLAELASYHAGRQGGCVSAKIVGLAYHAQ